MDQSLVRSLSVTMTEKQRRYLERLFEDNQDKILLRVFCSLELKRQVSSDLSDISKAEASQLIASLVAIATDTDGESF